MWIRAYGARAASRIVIVGRGPRSLDQRLVGQLQVRRPAPRSAPARGALDLLDHRGVATLDRPGASRRPSGSCETRAAGASAGTPRSRAPSPSRSSAAPGSCPARPSRAPEGVWALPRRAARRHHLVDGLDDDGPRAAGARASPPAGLERGGVVDEHGLLGRLQVAALGVVEHLLDRAGSWVSPPEHGTAFVVSARVRVNERAGSLGRAIGLSLSFIGEGLAGLGSAGLLGLPACAPHRAPRRRKRDESPGPATASPADLAQARRPSQRARARSSVLLGTGARPRAPTRSAGARSAGHPRPLPRRSRPARRRPPSQGRRERRSAEVIGGATGAGSLGGGLAERVAGRALGLGRDRLGDLIAQIPLSCGATAARAGGDAVEGAPRGVDQSFEVRRHRCSFGSGVQSGEVGVSICRQLSSWRTMSAAEAPSLSQNSAASMRSSLPDQEAAVVLAHRVALDLDGAQSRPTRWLIEPASRPA